MPDSPARTSAVTRVRVALLVVATLTVTGCGLRLETPPPEPPVPDAAETVRQRTVADAVALQDLAGGTEHPDPAVQLVLDAVAEASAAHVDALGGVYDPGTDPVGPEPSTGVPDTSPTPTAGRQDGDAAGGGGGGTADGETSADETVEVLVDALAETSATATADADAVEDGTVARVLAAVATSRLLLGERLAVADGAPAEGADRAEPWPATAPAVLPEGVTETDVLPLVTAEDLAGQAWEVVAARREGDARAVAAERAVVHRERARAWAEATEVAGTGLDPRRAGYALPPGLLSGEEPAATEDLATLETGLADAYATLVARAAPTQRTPLLAASADATAAAASLTGRLPTFPGMPELAG
ncbi:DUF4439 domain-containing protein [Actinotalea sp. Marseille-Q4924]|uniref:DUF4439 domain-containing protein n=1 Tax=Actinotalea sp. Marseille-Q4924 TaxID=2866571 RepID=UPI001CE41241|nr:DUF4439 domain-containing protein [Actinotalea sp. Marseille-Q4924]